MRAADLHHAREVLRLGMQRRAQLAHGGQQRALQLDGRGHVHGRGEGVVARLRHVHVIVRVHRLLAAALAPRHLDGAVADHLVHVHVALRATAGLPHAERKLAVKLAVRHFLGGRHDQVAQVGGKAAHVGVGLRAGGLQQAEGMHDGQRHAVAEWKVVMRTLGLRAPVAVGRNLDGSHGVGFGAGGSVGLRVRHAFRSKKGAPKSTDAGAARALHAWVRGVTWRPVRARFPPSRSRTSRRASSAASTSSPAPRGARPSDRPGSRPRCRTA